MSASDQDIVKTFTPAASPLSRLEISRKYKAVRDRTMHLAAPLSAEDKTVQSMTDASPTKWHLAHTTWFYETLILLDLEPDYTAFDPSYCYLFNSYYESLGARHPRPERGLLTRPSCEDIERYRAHVDSHMQKFIDNASGEVWARAASLIELGCHHEEQHQELILMDILHAFSCNPTWPKYRTPQPRSVGATAPLHWITLEGGDFTVGHGGVDFAFDNEQPRHDVKLRPFKLANRLVTNGEWLDFVKDGAYTQAELWLSDGWAYVQEHGWTAPEYWECSRDGEWKTFTLGGLIPIDLTAPVCHISYYEADAYARWYGKRLPTETEWEVAAQGIPRTGNFMESENLTPRAAEPSQQLTQMFGDVWEWTQSPYSPYPGFRPASGAVGEYNGKFMVNQMVMRGGCCATPADHIRATYRNFFYPHMRWQFGGLRLAEDA